MKNDQQKKKNTNKSKKQAKYRALSLVLTSSLVIAPLTVPLSFYLPGGITASAAVLDAEILSNISSSNNSGTTTGARWAADGATKNVDFSITGGELAGASAITSGKKQAVLAIPNQLNGRVAVNGPAQIDTNITLTLADVPFLSGTLTAVDNLSNALTDIVQNTIGNATGVNLNLTNVNQKIAALKNIENFGSASFTSTPTLAGNGSYISANIDDGLGLVLAQDVRTILQDLKTAIDQLNATGSNIILVPVVNTALAAAKVPIDAALNLAIPLVGVGGAGINQLADASLLGSTTVNIPTTVVSPTSLSQNLDARFVGTVVKTDVIDVSLISTANGVSDIYYAGTAAVVAPPVVTNTTGTSATGYTVTGTATAGDTVAIKNAGGTTIASGPATGGNFTITIPQGAAVENEQLQAIASNNGVDSTPTSFATPADPESAVTPPVVTNTTGTSATGYTVTGTATAGDTVTIKNAGGTTIASGPATGGNFSIAIPQGAATASEALTAIASKNGVDSTPTSFTTPADPVNVVAPPVVTNTTGTSTTGYTVTGTATAGDTVTIKNAGGTTIASGPATGGNFTITIPQGAAVGDEELQAIASNGSDTSLPTIFTTPADPVVITAPTISGVTGDSATGYTVTGTATPGDSIIIKNAGGAVIGSGVANGSGDFTVILLPGIATPNETLNAIASDGNGNESDPTSFTTPADAVIVPAPTVSNVTGNSATGYTVTGTATPGDNVVVKNASGIIIAAGIADPLGNFTAIIPIGLASPSEELNAIAVSGLNQSSATPFETPADAVVVPAPVVTGVTGNSSAGYTVTGTATPGDTVTVKNSGGTVLASGTADPLGQFSINLPIGSATPLESLNAIAFDGLGNQSSATPFITPPDLVIVAPPTVEGVTGSSASGYTVTGKATPGNLISIKNTGGTVIATAQADLLGNYTAVIPTGQATPNEQLKAIASDILGNQSIATNFNTPADPVLVGSPVITNVTGTSTTGYSVTGTATPGDTVLVKNTGGTIIGTGTTDFSGNFTVVIPVGSAMPSQQLSAIADDGNGHQSLATPFMTPSDPVVVGSPIVTGVTGSSSTGYTVTGTATPGDTITITNTGGTIIGTGVADSNGDFTVTVPAGSAAPNQQLTATAQDANGNTSPGTNFTTPADPVIVPAPVVTEVTGSSATGYTVKGSAVAGNTVLIKNTGGTIIASGIADSNGNFTATIPVGLATPNQQLTATADDGAGNQSSVTPFTTPADPVVVATPAVTNVTGTSTTGYTVTGTATPGDSILVKNTGGTVIGTGTADVNGDFTVILPIGSAVPNQQLSAIADDGNGNQSPGVPFMTPADPVVVSAPVVTGVTGSSNTGYTVTGTATPGDTVSVKNTGGTVVGSTVADQNGDFTVIIPIGSVSPSQQLTATAQDPDGNTSPGTSFITPADPVIVTAPTVTGVTGSSASGYVVTGSATAGDSILIKNTGGTVIGTATADPNGSFTVTIPIGLASPNEQLNAIADDGDGHQSSATPFTTPADSVVVNAPVVTGVTGSSNTGYTVTGTATPGDTVSIKNTGGTVVGSAVADQNGDFTVIIPVGSATPNQQLTATAQDSNGNTSPGTSFVTPADPVVVTAPTVSSVTGTAATGYTVNGTADAGNTVIIKNTGGTIIGTATADQNGNFTVLIPINLASSNELLVAVAEDGNGHQSSATPFTTPADPVSVTAPTVTNVTGSSSTGYTVTGTADAGDTVAITNTGGNDLGSATVDPSGKFSIVIQAGLATPSEQLKATASDAAGNQSSATPFTTPADPVVIPAPIVTSVTGNSSTGYTVKGTAKAGDTLLIKKLTGTEIGATTVDENGNYTVILPAGAALAREQLRAIDSDGAGHQSSATSFITPADPVVVASPIITSVTGNSSTGYTVKGTATPANSISLRTLSGAEVGTGSVDPNGDFTIELEGQEVNPLQQLHAIAIDDELNMSLPTLFTIPANPSSSIEAPTIENVTGTSKAGYIVTGKTTAGHKVKIRNAAGRVIGSGIADSNGQYSLIDSQSALAPDRDFSIALPTGSATEKEALTATAENNIGDVSTATPFMTPADPTVYVATPIVDSVTGNSMTGYTIKGIATPGNDVEIQNENGEMLAGAKASDNGLFVITIPIGFAEPQQLVSAIAKDEQGNKSEPAKFKLPADPGAGNGNNNGAGNGSNLGNNGSSGFNNLNSSQKNLPNNGEVFSNWGILGALLLGVFSFFTFKRTHKKEDE